MYDFHIFKWYNLKYENHTFWVYFLLQSGKSKKKKKCKTGLPLPGFEPATTRGASSTEYAYTRRLWIVDLAKQWGDGAQVSLYKPKASSRLWDMTLKIWDYTFLVYYYYTFLNSKIIHQKYTFKNIQFRFLKSYFFWNVCFKCMFCLYFLKSYILKFKMYVKMYDFESQNVCFWFFDVTGEWRPQDQVDL